MNLKNHKILVLYGPTAVGKTECALELSQLFPLEIINMDVGQFYKPLTIGTAKPDWKHSAVTHHLFDIINEPEDFTVIAYRQQVKKLCSEIWQRGNIPLLVGGSGFYLKSLLFPPIGEYNNIPRIKYDMSTEQLWEQLNSIDAIRAQSIHIHDRYRIERALALWYNTHQLPSQCTPQPDLFASCDIIWLTRERNELYGRINDRVHHMIHQGWIDEVRILQHMGWELFLLRKRLIGYNELCTYLNEPGFSLQKVITRIAQRTRHYAKRQETFYRMLQKKCIPISLPQHQIRTFSVNLTLSNLTLYIKQQHNILLV